MIRKCFPSKVIDVKWCFYIEVFLSSVITHVKISAHEWFLTRAVH